MDTIKQTNIHHNFNLFVFFFVVVVVARCMLARMNDSFSLSAVNKKPTNVVVHTLQSDRQRAVGEMTGESLLHT